MKIRVVSYGFSRFFILPSRRMRVRRLAVRMGHIPPCGHNLPCHALRLLHLSWMALAAVTVGGGDGVVCHSPCPWHREMCGAETGGDDILGVVSIDRVGV